MHLRLRMQTAAMNDGDGSNGGGGKTDGGDHQGRARVQKGWKGREVLIERERGEVEDTFALPEIAWRERERANARS